MSFHSIQYAAGQASGISNRTKPEAPVLTVNERPMIFYISKSDPKRDKYCKLINENGGIVAETPSNANNGIILLSSYNLGPEVANAFKTDFVKNSIEQGSLLALENYRWVEKPKRLSSDEIRRRAEALRNPPASKVSRKKSQRAQPTRSSIRYTKEQDEYILEQVRMDPKRRGTHQLYKELALHPMLEGHTGNSLRSRFRTHLVQDLHYVYEVDENGQLVYDSRGEKIRRNLDDLPGIKQRFTGEDDYNLCASLVKYNEERINLKIQAQEIAPEEAQRLDRYAPVPYSFFAGMEEQYGRHTAQSWRDRWRKFALVYGVKRYLAECTEAKKEGKPIQPMKNLTRKKDFSNIAAIKEGLGSHYDHNIGALDEEIGEVKSSNIDDALGHQKITPVIPPVLLEVDVVGSPDSRSVSQSKGSSQPDQASRNDIASEAQAVPAAQEASASQYFDGDSQSPYAQYLKDVKSVYNLFSNAFFSSSYVSLMDGLERLFREDDVPLEVLFKGLLDLGFREQLIGHVLKATSMIRPYVIKYLRYICSRLKDNTDLLSRPVDLLKAQDIEGIWNEESDSIIYKTWPNYRSDIVPELVRIHGKQNVDARNEFLSSIFLERQQERW